MAGEKFGPRNNTGSTLYDSVMLWGKHMRRSVGLSVGLIALVSLGIGPAEGQNYQRLAEDVKRFFAAYKSSDLRSEPSASQLAEDISTGVGEILVDEGGIFAGSIHHFPFVTIELVAAGDDDGATVVGAQVGQIGQRLHVGTVIEIAECIAVEPWL